MKRIISLIAVFLFATSSIALAAGQEVTSTTLTAVKFAPSTLVKVYAHANAAVFAAIAKHKNGTRIYGLASNSTEVRYSESVAAGVDVTDSALTASDSAAFSSWTSL